MTKNPLKVGFILFAITMLTFFIVYYFFANANYWNTTMQVNAFGMTFLYVAAGFISTYWLRQGTRITYPQAFKQTFVTLFTGGILSMLSIFLFLNYVDTDARDMLNHQYIQTELKNLDEAYAQKKVEVANHIDRNKITELETDYKNAKIGREAALKENRNYFSFKFMSAIFGGFLLFYLMLSIIIAGFMKNKKRYEE
ncbi:DUF4199 domain-containing protein [Epilithonimonas xixisoli]|uniref:Uncharacterized protein DUF4199 n=1 Tax=Epilithonimonas xixisoli TaxID=1476462 RepID=A0A4R8IAC2_9FLAO|nr:DUF4199 domain-containing protein [Epilithonimonas xixisoli]TDX86977.1 uncharacterized protein DUF4199 [Epilithonimonas xixisoli]